MCCLIRRSVLSFFFCVFTRCTNRSVDDSNRVVRTDSAMDENIINKDGQKPSRRGSSVTFSSPIEHHDDNGTNGVVVD